MLKLKDIIWETTLKCGKHCKYCGSLEILRKENPSKEFLLHVAREIGSYGVDVVTLSGGEPGELDFDVLISIVDILKLYNCSVRVITNGKMLLFSENLLKHFDVIGQSINVSNDHFYRDLIPSDKIVMVTNFGSHNIWQFDDLAEIANSYKSWQIQLTTGGVYQLNAEGITYLRKKIRELNNVKYVLADNLQDEHKCSAGINSCGITVDGDVIPCLSERTLGGIISSQGNLKNRSLKDIWESEFKDIRFSSKTWCNSCRNHIDYPQIKELTPTIAQIPHARGHRQQIPKLSCQGNVMSYGVTDWNIFMSDYKNEVIK